MRFPPEFLQQIKDRITLSNLIGQYVRLQKKGREWSGCCPVHKEKTPSFFVNDDKQFYHCFGCGAHGDAIGFLTNVESMEFLDAVEKLAGMAGLPMPAADSKTPRISNDEYDLMERAAKWFEAQLKTTSAAPARDYLAGRGIDEKTISGFRIGFAPNSRTALKIAATALGFSEAALLNLGLIAVPAEGGASYDKFRNRIIFPICDRRGKVIAFGGRIMGDGQPKYLNSPDTPLFHKGQVLYNFHNAKNEAARQKKLVVAEGYMDVIALARAGIPAVAPLGTAVTEQHLEMCWNMVDEPIFCLDGDAAGKRAMQRVAELSLPHLKPGKSISFVTLASGMDPDSIFKNSGAEALQSAISKPVTLSEHLLQAALADFGYGQKSFTPERRAAMEKKLDDWCSQISDYKVRSSYKDFFYRRRREIYSSGRNAHPAPARGGYNPAAEIECLALIINHPEILIQPGNEESFAAFEFSFAEHVSMQSYILNALTIIDNISSYKLFETLDEEARKIANGLKSNPLVEMSSAIASNASHEVVMKAWRQCLERMTIKENKLDPSNMTEDDWESYVRSKTSGQSPA